MDLSTTQELSISSDGSRLVVGKPEIAEEFSGKSVFTSSGGSSMQARNTSHQVAKSFIRGSSSRVPLVPRRHLETLRKGGVLSHSTILDLKEEQPSDSAVEWALAILTATWFPILLALGTMTCWSELSRQTLVVEGSEVMELGMSREVTRWIVRVFSEK